MSYYRTQKCEAVQVNEALRAKPLHELPAWLLDTLIESLLTDPVLILGDWLVKVDGEKHIRRVTNKDFLQFFSSRDPSAVIGAKPMTAGVELIDRERDHQLAEYSAAHDAEHRRGELVEHAILLLRAHVANVHGTKNAEVSICAEDSWGLCSSNTTPVDRLAVAGSLVAAEIDRLRNKIVEATRP